MGLAPEDCGNVSSTPSLGSVPNVAVDDFFAREKLFGSKLTRNASS